jgi:PAS domain S-box-containing protein
MFKNSEISKLNLNEVIMDSMPGNVYILDEEGKIVACNLNATKVYGYNGEEFLNRSVLDFIDEVDHEKVINTMASSKVDEIIQVENTALTKDGKKIPYLGSATTVFINDKKYFIGLGVDISELNSARKIIQDQMCEISKLNELLNAENIYLKDQLELRGDGHNIIGVSEHLKYIMYKINQVGPTKASVLIQGETGTGKELVAKAIHEKSERKNKQFIKVNCASIPENLIESELFGHEKGAFTGAIEKCI